MNSTVDKTQVLRQFSRAANLYDAAASLQQEMSKQLIKLLEPYTKERGTHSIVDLGCGTGTSLKALSGAYKKALLTGVDLSQPMLDIAAQRVPKANLFCSDIELYRPTKPHDLYFSNASLQWCDFQQVTENLAQSLDQDGLFALTSFAPKTHQEISRSWGKVDKLPHRIHFHSLERHIEILDCFGFQILESKTELHQIPFQNVDDLLNSIKMTGATNALKNRARGLLSRERYQQFIQELGQQSPLLLSYEVIYLVAKKLR